MGDEQLLDDPQWIVYGRWAAVSFDVPYVVGHWNYVRRTKPKAKPVYVGATAGELERRFRKLHLEVAVVMCQDEESEEPPPRTLGHCGAFGGCEYRNECLADVSVGQLLLSHMERNK